MEHPANHNLCFSKKHPNNQSIYVTSQLVSAIEIVSTRYLLTPFRPSKMLWMEICIALNQLINSFLAFQDVVGRFKHYYLLKHPYSSERCDQLSAVTSRHPLHLDIHYI